MTHINPKQAGYNIMDSAVDAFSVSNILKRLFLFLVFGVILGLRTLISNLDKVGQGGGGILKYILAINGAIWEGVTLSLGSMWKVIINPISYFSSGSWGSIIFTALALIVLVMFFYQPVSLLVNIFDGQKGHSTGMALRAFVTFVVVIILSCSVFYMGSGDTLTSDINSDGEILPDDVNSTIGQDDILNITDTVDNLSTTVKGSVISLL